MEETLSCRDGVRSQSDGLRLIRRKSGCGSFLIISGRPFSASSRGSFQTISRINASLKYQNQEPELVLLLYLFLLF